MSRQMLALWLGALALVLAACSSGQPAAEPTAAPAEPTAAAAEPTAAPAEPTAAPAEPTQAAEAPTSAPAGQAPTPAPAPAAGGRLQAVKDRGTLICGVNGGLPGFSNLEANGEYTGFDADFCRVVAAAVLGDAQAVEFRPLSTQERFTAVQSGEVDVLFRNTTWTISRDSSVGMDFGPTTFYDGQGIMVRRDLNATTLEDLDGGTICVQSGTTTELNLTDQFRARGISFTPVVFEEIDPTYQAYDEGRCDAVTSDRSQLIARRTTMQNPDEHVILDVVISKEPLGPAVAQGDSQWRDVVTWAVYATIAAEEFGINSGNVQEFLSSENPDIRRFLGVEGDLGPGIGLDPDFTVNIIEGVGNYGEIYDRNLGPNTPFNLERGPNALWTEGGLMYAPPFR
ncbi:MAG: amino acid ABC transporter substrate-binding protein [Chloroflexota bacterium]|nr:MAG: amino acid ABC transporter substrate-binding protein [Chloroflexota bacterium]